MSRRESGSGCESGCESESEKRVEKSELTHLNHGETQVKVCAGSGETAHARLNALLHRR